VRRNCRQVESVCRFGAGGICRAFVDPADRGGADPVAELEQLALDPQVSPAGILRSEPPDERGDLGADRRASRPVRMGPFPGDQPVHPQSSRQELDECGEDRAVGPVQAWPGMGAAQHGNLVPQHKELDVLGRR